MIYLVLPRVQFVANLITTTTTYTYTTYCKHFGSRMQFQFKPRSDFPFSLLGLWGPYSCTISLYLSGLTLSSSGLEEEEEDRAGSLREEEIAHAHSDHQSTRTGRNPL